MATSGSIFSGCENNVMRVASECNDGINVIFIEGFNTAIPVTGYTLDLSTNHQFLHSLDEFIYAFAFGDRIGELTLTGVVFTGKSCDRNGRNITAQIGQQSIYDWYLSNKFSRNLKPSKILIGQSAVKLIGFLTGLRMQIPDPALPVAQWALRFNVIIDTTSGSPSTAGGGGGAASAWQRAYDAANAAFDQSADELADSLRDALQSAQDAFNSTLTGLTDIFGGPENWGPGPDGTGGTRLPPPTT